MILIAIFGSLSFLTSGVLLFYAKKQTIKWPWIAFSIMMGAVGILCIFRFLGKSLFFYPEGEIVGNNVVLFSFFPVSWLIALIMLSKSIGREKLEKRIEQLRTLNEIALHFQHEITSDQIMKLIAEQLKRLIPYQDAAFYLLDDERQIIYPVFATGDWTSSIMEKGELSVAVNRDINEILEGRPRLMYNSITDGQQDINNKKTSDTKSILAAPLLLKNRPIGIIEIRRDESETFTNEEIEFISLLAQQAAIIYENSRLLGEMEREKDSSRQYLDLLSHDIANLNTPLYSYFDIILNEQKINDESKQVVKKVYGQVERINSLLLRVRKLSKAEIEDVKELKTHDVLKKLEEAITSLKHNYPQQKIVINIGEFNDSRKVNTGDMLDEVFFNILHNAVKYSKVKEARIDVTFKIDRIKEKDFLVIKFCDYGIGIRDDLKEHIFDNKKDTAASFARGFDIDLNSCRRYVEKWGGMIRVENRVMDNYAEGACFEIELPISL